MRERCQALLKNTPGTFFSGDDHNFLMQVFAGHPDFKDRTKGQQIKFQVRLNVTLGYPSKGFWIVRQDGTASDISYIKALQSDKRKPEAIQRDDVLKALRAAIAPDIAAFRKTIHLDVDTCPITGELLTSGNCHIDHYDKPFVVLADAFIRQFGLDYLASKLNPSDDGQTATFFTDPFLIQTFRDYHNANTHLRAVSVIANTKILKNEQR